LKTVLLEPYFLTLDNQGKLRIHHVQEKVQEVLNSEDIYTSATFSLDGRYIYAINKDQEICIINFHRELENKIVLKRVIPGLDAKTMISTHILQIPSNMLIIGSIERTIEDLNEITKLYLHVICGDISDHNSELKIKEFNVSKLESLDHKHPIIFRSFYVKERQLLLFGNTASDKVQTFYFGFDGSIKEIDVLDLEGATLRGITYQREIIKNKRQKPKLTVEYQNKKFRIPKPPSVLIWDSKGSMHHFHYCDTRYAVQAFSSTIQLSVPEFNLQEELIKKKLNRKRRSRCKSSNPRRIKEVIKEKRGCSLTREGVLKSQSNLESFKLELKKMKEVMPLKNITNGLLSNSKTLTENCIENKKQNTEVNKNSISTSKSSLFLPNKEKIAPSQTSTSLWSSNNNKAEGPSTSKSNLFSASTSSLFSSASTSSSRSSLFQTTKVKETKTSQNGLFSLEKQPDSQESFKTPNLFPETLKSESFLQAFQMAPIVKDKKSKRAALFLNKFESDVVFKVENEEFYAHKSILSENCTFFKRMFASGMLESSSSVIEIHDTKAPVFRAFLEYLYVYKTELNEDLVLDVLDFADKYVVKDLKNYCENYFIRILASENCFKFFEIACLYNATYLKERLLYHFKKELKEIIEKKDIYNLPINSYRYILDMHWKDKVILGPPFSKLIE